MPRPPLNNVDLQTAQVVSFVIFALLAVDRAKLWGHWSCHAKIYNHLEIPRDKQILFQLPELRNQNYVVESW